MFIYVVQHVFNTQINTPLHLKFVHFFFLRFGSIRITVARKAEKEKPPILNSLFIAIKPKSLWTKFFCCWSMQMWNLLFGRDIFFSSLEHRLPFYTMSIKFGFSFFFVLFIRLKNSHKIIEIHESETIASVDALSNSILKVKKKNEKQKIPSKTT